MNTEHLTTSEGSPSFPSSNLWSALRSHASCVQVVQYKQQSRLEEKRKKALDLQLDFIVGQTEKYSDLLSKSLAPIRPPEAVAPAPRTSLPAPVDDEGESLTLIISRNKNGLTV